MSCDHDFRLEGLRQVYIDDELSGSIDFYGVSNVEPLNLQQERQVKRPNRRMDLIDLQTNGM
jgi:hypothetical protein